MFGLCVFGNSGYCQILHQSFWLMQMDLWLDLELSMGSYLRICKQCCNFSRELIGTCKFEHHRHKDNWFLKDDWFKSKLEIIALSSVVYKIKNSCPSTEPCGTPYESVTLSDRVSFIFTD